MSDEIPEFLYDYIDVPEMQYLGGICVACGTNYTNICENDMFFSTLDHSIGVALIVWNFTKDKKQTLAALFHDISTPVFKHCVDFLNGDYETQESTEMLTTVIIKNSKEIMGLLKRDGIKVEEVNDYHIYPIADNDTPKLSSDRLEYTLTNGLGVRKKVWNIDTVKKVYNDIEVQKNENGIEELGFKNVEYAELFQKVSCKLGIEYMRNEIKISMQFIADCLKKMIDKKYLCIEDLYKLSENEIINMIENCENKEISEKFKMFRKTDKIIESDKPIANRYGISLEVKKRYINPLVRMDDSFVRISDVSSKSKKVLEDYFNFKTKKYAYLDFEF